MKVNYILVGFIVFLIAIGLYTNKSQSEFAKTCRERVKKSRELDSINQQRQLELWK